MIINDVKKIAIEAEYKIMYERVINVVTLAHRVCLESYFVKLYFLKTLNREISSKRISKVRRAISRIYNRIFLLFTKK